MIDEKQEAAPDGPRLLVWGAERIGDAVMTLPGIAMARSHVPGVRVTFVATDYAREVAEVCGLVDEVFRIGFRTPFWNFFRYRALRRRVRRGDFDRIALFGKVTRFTSYVAPLERASYVPREDSHFAQAFGMAVAHAFDLDTAEFPMPVIRPPRPPGWEEEFRRKGLNVGRERYVVFHPGTNRMMRFRGTGRGSAARRVPKHWPHERFRELAVMLRGRWPEVRLACVGTEAERQWVEAGICRPLPEAERPVNLCGATSVSSMLRLLEGAAALVCGDSGVMHLATTVRAPIVALLGPTRADATGPFGIPSDRFVVVRSMPEDEALLDRECMRKIPAERVFQRVAEFIERGHSGGAPR